MTTWMEMSTWWNLVVCLTILGAISAGPRIENNPPDVFVDEVESQKNNQDAVITTTTTPSPPVTSGTGYRQHLAVVQPWPHTQYVQKHSQPQTQYIQKHRSAVDQQSATVQKPPQTQFPQYQNPRSAVGYQPQTHYIQNQWPPIVQQWATIQKPPQASHLQSLQYQIPYRTEGHQSEFQYQYPRDQQSVVHHRPQFQQYPKHRNHGAYYAGVTSSGYSPYSSQPLPALGASYYSSSFGGGTPSFVNVSAAPTPIPTAVGSSSTGVLLRPASYTELLRNVTRLFAIQFSVAARSRSILLLKLQLEHHRQ